MGRTYYFSAIFRWPTAQQPGRHDDAASNDERKQKQFRTGARRTNKKRHILGALGYLLTFYTTIFCKFTTNLFLRYSSTNQRILIYVFLSPCGNILTFRIKRFSSCMMAG
ncbi:hypothetical protein BKA59DRAFT_11282 [Fusarium tricinctum]|uniref:Uncharacterized protein n=1 Tax=Fusarium tricinctum TaxID=61284 RepID=A0A8K0S922_9HYPO|nr:hypothetical protein BKA59DRAFT_11282 [Fusarium tricinctum]